MTLEEYKETLQLEQAPSQLDKPLQAMWYAANGNWEKAHDLAQELNDSASAWVHAYLHREEGDISNAQYWYSRANRSVPHSTLEQEWDMIVSTLL
ncbi:MAG: hypothetical protein ACFB15_10920 [Cyclobacteriaceae bacterium]